MVATPSRPETMSVLVLEKDDTVAGEACRALQDAGVRILGPFRNATDAIGEVDRQKPSCALVDIDLGRGPNYATTRTLIALGIPIVLIAGYASGPTPADLENLPRLLKPVDGRKAVAAVHAICRM